MSFAPPRAFCGIVTCACKPWRSSTRTSEPACHRRYRGKQPLDPGDRRLTLTPPVAPSGPSQYKKVSGTV